MINEEAIVTMINEFRKSSTLATSKNQITSKVFLLIDFNETGEKITSKNILFTYEAPEFNK